MCRRCSRRCWLNDGHLRESIGTRLFTIGIISIFYRVLMRSSFIFEMWTHAKDFRNVRVSTNKNYFCRYQLQTIPYEWLVCCHNRRTHTYVEKHD